MFKELAETVQHYLSITPEMFRSWFEAADFTKTHDFIKDLKIFNLYSSALCHPYIDIKKFKLQKLDQLFETDGKFTYSFFTNDPQQFLSSDEEWELDLSKRSVNQTPSLQT